MYYPPHIKSFLTSLKISGDKATMSVADLRKLVRLVLHDIEVDEDWYLENYTDVSQAVDEGHVRDATEHFVNSGYYEGRFPCKPIIDRSFYLELYDDIREAADSGALEDVESHFLGMGYQEARVGTNFPVDEQWYLQTYRVRLDEEIVTAKQHFDQIGYVAGYRPYPSRV
jgi:hypothetical protein